MSTLIVPAPDAVPFPSLGGQVCAWIEDNLVFGPGDLRGEPARLDDEKRALIWRAYEVWPRGHRNEDGELDEGRRRFKRVAVSLRKGSAKTEWAAWIVAAELHPDAPVRCIGWTADGQPIGGGVTDPYIPMVAYTEDQTEELAYGALKAILENSTIAGDFDIGLARIMRIRGDGKAEALASSPNSNDGARTTFQHFDETHRFTLPRLKRAHQTMQANIPKRKLADAWSLETTTAFAPGEGSIAEATFDYARQIADGKIKDSSLFFFHRQAGDHIDIFKKDGSLDMAAVRRAVGEASGPVGEWSDLTGITDQFKDPTTDIAYLQRVWLNRPLRASGRAFDATKWADLKRPDYTEPDGNLITLGFDGARYKDSTALMGCGISSGHLFTLGIWERPTALRPELPWEVPEAEVEETLKAAMQRWDVWRLYADPPYWETHVAKWAGEYGEERVMNWRTNRTAAMAGAIRSFDNAISAGELSHDGNKALTAHVGNACRRVLTLKDDQGVPLWTIYKERPDSPHKIDASVAAVLAWEARRDALAAGMGESRKSIYEERGILSWG